MVIAPHFIKEGHFKKETIDAHIATHKGYYTEGETIQLSCTGNGFPAPSVEWVKDDRTLVTENNVQVDAGNLSVKSASVEDSGTYKCIAKNNKNKAEAITTVQIKLHGPMIQCLDKLSRTRCMSIVRAHLCGIRYFYSSCCQSCEKVSRRPK
ncbi:hypothetical protein Btru_052354 [Bulinus truncatus]|nr:hypothetical protein Btru_052354 [Bulinus truncatus]